MWQFIVAQPFIALITLYGKTVPKGRFIIFSRVELVNFPVFVWSDRLSFAKKSAFDLKFRLSTDYSHQQFTRIGLIGPVASIGLSKETK
jgi:hypothetical protein